MVVNLQRITKVRCHSVILDPSKQAKTDGGLVDPGRLEYLHSESIILFHELRWKTCDGNLLISFGPD